MKKMLVVAGLMLAGVCASAQNYFGVTGGYNLSNHFISEWNLTSIDPIEGGVSYDYYCKSGFNAGLSFEHRFAPKSNGGNWFLGVSALYSLEGYNIRSEIAFADGYVKEYDTDCDIKLLKFPVSFGFNFKVNEKVGFAPKVYGIFARNVGAQFSFEKLSRFSYGGGANINIGERSSIGVGYDWYVSEKNIWNGNAHVNFTYYIFSTKKNAE